MSRRTVLAPDPGFTGARAGVAFRDGRGEVEPGNGLALAYFARHGYTLDAPATPTKKGRSPAPADKPAATPTSEGEPPDA